MRSLQPKKIASIAGNFTHSDFFTAKAFMAVFLQILVNLIEQNDAIAIIMGTHGSKGNAKRCLVVLQ